MPAGFKVGPLDPEATRELGKVSAPRAARELLRRHRKLYPGALTAALSRPTNEPRSRGLDMAEVDAAVRAWWDEFEEGVPEGYKLVGASVHGADDSPQFVGYTYVVESGRTGKGALPYDAEAFPVSYAGGTVQTRVAEAKEAGVPVALNAPPAGEVEALRAELAEAQAKLAEREPEPEGETREELLARLAEYEQKLAEAQAAKTDADPPEPYDDGADAPNASREGGGDGDPTDPPEPWPGYDGQNRDDLMPLLKEIDEATARRVVAFEKANKNRTTLIAAADAIIDAPTG